MGLAKKVFLTQLVEQHDKHFGQPRENHVDGTLDRQAHVCMEEGEGFCPLYLLKHQLS